MKKKILLIATGGTIASEPSEEGLRPGMLSGELITSVPSIADEYDIEARDLFQLDSSNIQPEEWKIMAGAIYTASREFDGIVVTHGTDTMAYTSSVLSFMLPNIQIPVVLTGSQLPISNPLTDAKDNLISAFTMAASGSPGVFLAFNRKIMRGNRAVKVRTKSFDAFESINCLPVAKIDVGGLVVDKRLIRAPSGQPELRDALCSDVFLLKIIPGLNPGIIDMLRSSGCRGVVVEAFGAGGMHFMRRNLVSSLQALAESGVIVIVCSQCLYEACDFTIYQTGMRLVEHDGIIQAGDMTTEAAVTKLMWCLGQEYDVDRIRELFSTDLAGEISV